MVLTPEKHQSRPQASSKHVQPGLGWAYLEAYLSRIEGGAREIDSTLLPVETLIGAHPEAFLLPTTFQLQLTFNPKPT